MDSEFVAAYAQSQGALKSLAAPSVSPDKSLVETIRDGARTAVQESVRYFLDRLPPGMCASSS